ASRSTSTAGCRTTAAGAPPTGRFAPRGSSMRIGSWSAAAMVLFAGSIQTIRTRSTGNFRTAICSAATSEPANRSRSVPRLGTDDGALWVTRDGGSNWTNVADKVGLPGPRWISSIDPSRYIEGRAYVVFDGHRSDDDDPYVFVTEDFGQTWKSLRSNLPWGST